MTTADPSALPTTGPLTMEQFRAVAGYDWETCRTIFLSGKGPGFYAGKRLICRWEWVHKWLAGEVGMWSPPVIESITLPSDNPFLRTIDTRKAG